MGFHTAIVHEDGASPVYNTVVAKWTNTNAVAIGWGVTSSTRNGRVTFVKSSNTQWMVDFQASTSTNPASGFYQAGWTGNGYQTQPASGTGQLGGIQFIFDVGNIDLGTVCVHYS